MDLKELV